jgi:hypothetical protein
VATWTERGSLQGPQGEPGPDGADGPPGVDGKTVLNGVGAPDNSLGSDGDFYIDTTPGELKLYGPKAAGDWPDGIGFITSPTDESPMIIGGLASIVTEAPTSESLYPASALSLAQAPFSQLWHDLLAFNRHFGVPVYETSADGTTGWAEDTPDFKLFSNRDGHSSVEVIDGTALKGARWTWNNSQIAFSNSAWLVLGIAWPGEDNPNKVVTVESSDDGETWTVRHQTTHDYSSEPVWHFIEEVSGTSDDEWFRLTINTLTDGAVRLSSIRLLTARWGDQGGGPELSYPYTWTPDGWLGIGLGTDSPNAALEVSGDAIISGTLTLSGSDVLDILNDKADAATVTSALAGKQPLDSDLTAIAALTSGTGNVLAADGSGWTVKSYSALKTSLSLSKSDVGLGNVDNTADTAKPVSTAQQTALDLKADASALTSGLAGKQPLDSDLTAIAALAPSDGTFIKRVSSAWAASTLTKSDVGLGNVDNTADTAKPISTATQTALDGKQGLDADLTDIAGLTSTDGDYLRRVSGHWSNITTATLKSSLSLSKSDVGLGNVDNTADTAKPISSATQTALDGKQPLDSDLTDIAALVATTDNFMVAAASKWASRTPTQAKAALALTKSDVGLGSVDNTADTAKPISSATQTALNGKQDSNSHLSAIAALTATTNNFLVAVSSEWASRTPTQVKTTLALENVNNTADTAKPVSTAQQTALDGKQNLNAALTSISGLSPTNDDILQRKSGAWINRSMSQLKTDLVLSKSDVGLSNVDNTADTAKPVSTAQQTALDGKQDADTDLTDIAILTPTNNDVLQRKAGAWTNRTLAQLKSDLAISQSDVSGLTSALAGKVSSISNSDSYSITVDTSAFPAVGIKISDALMADVSANIATKQAGNAALTDISGLSPTDGDYLRRVSGHWSNVTTAALKTSLSLSKADVGLGSVDNTADTAKPVSSAQQTALDGKQALDSDLTAIAGLSPTDNDIIQRKSGAWVNRTLAQLLSDLALGSVYQPLDADLTAIAALSPSEGQVLTFASSTWTAADPSGGSDWSDEVETLADSATLSPDAVSGAVKCGVCTALNQDASLSAPINGSQGQTYRAIIKANAANRTITFSGFVASSDWSTAAYTITSGKWGIFSFVYVSAIGWLIAGKLSS